MRRCKQSFFASTVASRLALLLLTLVLLIVLLGLPVVLLLANCLGHSVAHAPSHCMQSMHWWLSCTHPSGAFDTLGHWILLVVSTSLALEGLSLLRDPLNLPSRGGIHYHSTIDPSPLLLWALLILCYVLLTLATRGRGALGLMVHVMDMLAL